VAGGRQRRPAAANGGGAPPRPAPATGRGGRPASADAHGESVDSGMRRDELVRWLDDYLAIGDYEDKSLNGLQVEGRDEVTKVAVAVDATLATLEQAADMGADMLITHHGLFWGRILPIVGPHRRRVEYLLRHEISLYACHIPLDAHREVGNNYGIARLLGLDDLEDFAFHGSRTIGVKGRFPTPMALRDLADLVERELGESVLVHAGGPLEIATLGIVSGGAAGDVVAAANEGLDAFLTGEPSHALFAEPFERGINALFAGHYMTETVGVKLLARELEGRFGLATEFVLLPTGL
jgi:dinuclear metal center YbgI/SA1388 family protein